MDPVMQARARLVMWAMAAAGVFVSVYTIVAYA